MNIKELKLDCYKADITQKDIAKVINKTEATVSKIFNLETELKLSDATKIANYLNMTNERRGIIFLN